MWLMWCPLNVPFAWWRHQMETFSTLLALCVGNSPVTGEFPEQRPVTLSFDVFFDLHLNKWLSKQLWGWWFETPSRSLWRHYNGIWELNCLWHGVINQLWFEPMLTVHYGVILFVGYRQLIEKLVLSSYDKRRDRKLVCKTDVVDRSCKKDYIRSHPQ